MLPPLDGKGLPRVLRHHKLVFATSGSESRLLPNKNDGDGGPRMCLIPLPFRKRRASQMALIAVKPANK